MEVKIECENAYKPVMEYIIQKNDFKNLKKVDVLTVSFDSVKDIPLRKREKIDEIVNDKEVNKHRLKYGEDSVKTFLIDDSNKNIEEFRKYRNKNFNVGIQVRDGLTEDAIIEISEQVLAPLVEKKADKSLRNFAKKLFGSAKNKSEVATATPNPDFPVTVDRTATHTSDLDESAHISLATSVDSLTDRQQGLAGNTPSLVPNRADRITKMTWSVNQNMERRMSPPPVEGISQSMDDIAPVLPPKTQKIEGRMSLSPVEGTSQSMDDIAPALPPKTRNMVRRM